MDDIVNSTSSSVPEMLGYVQRMVCEIASGFDSEPSLFTYVLFRGLQRHYTPGCHDGSLASHLVRWLGEGSPVTTATTLLAWICLNSVDAARTEVTEEKEEKEEKEEVTTMTTGTTTGATTTAPLVPVLEMPLLGLSLLQDELIRSLTSFPLQDSPSAFDHLLSLILECSEKEDDVWFKMVADVLLECVRPRVIDATDKLLHQRAQHLYTFSFNFYQTRLLVKKRRKKKTDVVTSSKEHKEEETIATLKDIDSSTMFYRLASLTEQLLNTTDYTDSRRTQSSNDNFLDCKRHDGRQEMWELEEIATKLDQILTESVKIKAAEVDSTVLVVSSPSPSLGSLAWTLWKRHPRAFCSRLSLHRLFCDEVQLDCMMSMTREMKIKASEETSRGGSENISLERMFLAQEAGFWSNTMTDTSLDPGLAWMLMNEERNMMSYQHLLTKSVAFDEETVSTSSTSTTSSSSTTSTTSATSTTSKFLAAAEKWQKWQKRNIIGSINAIEHADVCLNESVGEIFAVGGANGGLAAVHLIELAEIILGYSLQLKLDGKDNESNQETSPETFSLSGCPAKYLDRILSLMLTLTRAIIKQHAPASSSSTTFKWQTVVLVLHHVWSKILSTSAARVAVSMLLLSLRFDKTPHAASLSSLVHQCRTVLDLPGV